MDGIVNGRLARPNFAMIGSRTWIRSAPETIQTICCVIPTAPIPSTLPASMVSDGTLATTTSATRVVFSSITPRRMLWP